MTRIEAGMKTGSEQEIVLFDPLHPRWNPRHPRSSSLNGHYKESTPPVALASGSDMHGPNTAETRDPVTERYNARLGLVLFAVYLVAYVAFMLVNAFAPAWMDAAVGGLNVAVVSGLGLIGGAVLLAVVYAFACRVPNGGGRS